MKVEELMIGDWVHLISTIHNVSFPDNGVIQDEGYTTTRTPIKITTVSENCVSYYSNKLELYITLSSEDIEPIPLTPEILEKNGFEGIKEGRFPSLRNHYNDIIFQLERIKEERYCKILYIFKNIPICYVHELQHALKLCKINKEIII
jgi:hypothetical protein